ncbi:MAG TPA: hypothetical protein VHO47_00280 [Candidatus Babeliales bacterium]|nr:hypothetical protein [Candidatus Babeliales bacterium]
MTKKLTKKEKTNTSTIKTSPKRTTPKATGKSTYDELMEAKTPQQRKKFEEGYKELLLSEMILAAMENDDVSVRELARLAGVSPTIVQEMRSGTKESFNTKSFFKVLKGLGYNFLLEKNGQIIPISPSGINKK